MHNKNGCICPGLALAVGGCQSLGCGWVMWSNGPVGHAVKLSDHGQIGVLVNECNVPYPRHKKTHTPKPMVPSAGFAESCGLSKGYGGWAIHIRVGVLDGVFPTDLLFCGVRRHSQGHHSQQQPQLQLEPSLQCRYQRGWLLKVCPYDPHSSTFPCLCQLSTPWQGRALHIHCRSSALRATPFTGLCLPWLAGLDTGHMCTCHSPHTWLPPPLDLPQRVHPSLRTRPDQPETCCGGQLTCCCIRDRECCCII